MGLSEDVEFASNQLVRDLRAVRDAQLREAAGTVPSDLSDLRRTLQAAGVGVREFQRLLKTVETRVNALEEDARITLEERARRASSGPSIAALPAQAGPVESVPLGALGRPPSTNSIEVGGERVMPKSQQELVFRRAAKRRGRF